MDQETRHSIDAEVIKDNIHEVDCCVAGVIVRTIVITTGVRTTVGSKFVLAR